ncbi:hypothetical protein QBC41DRAFT_235104 [Cercophora samala]|uniref:Protein kinase domain-containing protein n=1 Tax=Cercophora samala TaxID=330535 RepID=A0AA39Z305_9PEZI|nr:hypothetical protein QBC41DRAFT_235104 [Cercophora samala]
MAPRVPDHTYYEGAVLEMHRHLPPEPFGIVNEVRYKPLKKRREWNAFCSSAGRLSRVEFAQAHPPITTAKVKHPESRSFTITRIIEANEDTDGAMLFEGVVTSASGKRNELMAKVYDGVYYSLDLMLGDPWRDPDYPDFMTKADLDYALESRAYEEIRLAGLAGSVAPNFYGAWSISLRAGGGGQAVRDVRMILLEKIHGACTMGKMITGATTWEPVLHRDLLPPATTRTEVMRNLLAAYNLIWWYAQVELEPISPRNVLIRKDNSVALINFEYAIVHRYIQFRESFLYHPKIEEKSTDLCPHPAMRHWPFYGFCGVSTFSIVAGIWWQWVPEEWLDDPEQAAEWLLESCSFFDSTRFGPLTREFLDCPHHENRSPRVLWLLKQLGRRDQSTDPDSQMGQGRLFAGTVG